MLRQSFVLEKCCHSFQSKIVHESICFQCWGHSSEVVLRSCGNYIRWHLAGGTRSLKMELSVGSCLQHSLDPKKGRTASVRCSHWRDALPQVLEPNSYTLNSDVLNQNDSFLHYVDKQQISENSRWWWWDSSLNSGKPFQFFLSNIYIAFSPSTEAHPSWIWKGQIHD